MKHWVGALLELEVATSQPPHSHPCHNHPQHRAHVFTKPATALDLAPRVKHCIITHCRWCNTSASPQPHTPPPLLPAPPCHTPTPHLPAPPFHTPCRYDQGGAAMAVQPLAEGRGGGAGGGRNDRRVHVVDIEAQGLGRGPQPDYVAVRGLGV